MIRMIPIGCRKIKKTAATFITTLLWAVLLWGAVFIGADTAWAETPGTANRKIEIWLAADRRPDEPEIRKRLTAVGFDRISIAYFRAGKPPKNFALGRDIPVEAAHLIIQLAEEYNGGIEFLISGGRFFPWYATIGSSAFDEIVQVPVTQADVDRLKDSTLTSEAFQDLYRKLTGDEAVP